MISVLKRRDGMVFGYIEWYVLDEYGQFKENGEYLWIHECWIHKDFRHPARHELQNLIKKIDDHVLARNAKWVYWRNRKHSERKTPLYRREVFKRRIRQWAEKQVPLTR
jgi:hypothetical protein